MTYMGLVPRVHTSFLLSTGSPRQEALPFAFCVLRTPLLLALWVGHHAASRCRCLQVTHRGRQMCSCIGCRSRNGYVEYRDNQTSTRRAADATPHSTIGGKQNHTNAKKNNDQGTSTLLSTPMFCAPRHIRVLCSPVNVQSPYPCPTT